MAKGKITITLDQYEQVKKAIQMARLNLTKIENLSNPSQLILRVTHEINKIEDIIKPEQE